MGAIERKTGFQWKENYLKQKQNWPPLKKQKKNTIIAQRARDFTCREKLLTFTEAQAAFTPDEVIKRNTGF